MKASILILPLVLTVVGNGAHANEPGEAMVKLRSTVSGNQELPKVMYIVPWQTSQGGVSQYALEAGIAQELFVPLEREEFQREISYGELLDKPEPAASK